ncbi:MAG TPA: hypothetical protein VF747_13265 [Blastocatellia bacterium]|jgi:hypothetical protein
MKLKITQIILTGAALVAFTVESPYAMAQDDTVKGKTTAGGQMKEGGKEMGKAGKSLGSNVKRGRVARGGKQFGKHAYHGGKHIGKGTVKAAKTTTKAVKKAVTP